MAKTLKQLKAIEAKLEREIDKLDDLSEKYSEKAEDLQEKLDAIYDQIADLESAPLAKAASAVTKNLPKISKELDPAITLLVKYALSRLQ